MGLFSSKDGHGEQLAKEKGRLSKAEKELRDYKETGDRKADRAVLSRIRQDLSVARANVRDVERW